MNLGETGNFISYAFAPASVVAPLGTVSASAHCMIFPCFIFGFSLLSLLIVSLRPYY
jgi:hypothetical protein